MEFQRVSSQDILPIYCEVGQIFKSSYISPKCCEKTYAQNGIWAVEQIISSIHTKITYCTVVKDFTFDESLLDYKYTQ